MAVLTESISFLMWLQNFKASQKEKGGKQIMTKIFESILYIILRMLNYCQMLVAMTFNFWLILFIAIF